MIRYLERRLVDFEMKRAPLKNFNLVKDVYVSVITNVKTNEVS